LIKYKNNIAFFLLFFTISLNSIAQSFYSGTVIDENSIPIFGASIIIKNNSNFVQTEIDGKFLIEAKTNDTLLISYSGYKNLEFRLSNDYELNNIILREDIKLLDEVVVIGYGNQSKEILTSSVSLVKGDDLTNEPVLNATQALQGKAAGVHIISSDAPGVSSQVIIRGLGTIQAGREPLYVVDGILTNNINNINTADIETISILKDAASLAIYGNRGANGVIIVSTKKGKEEEIKVSYDNFIGIREISYRPLMANTNSYVTYSNEAILFNLLNDSNPNNDNNFSAFFPSEQLYNTNWLNEISQLGYQSNHNISASGGNENLKTFFSVGLNQEEGILKGSELKRATLRSNLNYKISEKIKFSHNISFQLANSQPKSFGVFTTAYKQAPIVPVRDENGRYGSSVAFNNVGNPVAQLDLQNEKQRFLKLQGAFKIDYEIIDNLNFTSRFSVETNHNRFYNFDNRLATYLSLEPGNTIDNFQPTDPEAEQIPETVLYVSHSNDYRWFFDNYFTYKKTINDSHNFDVTLGLVAEENKYETLYGSRIYVPADENLNFNLYL
jgi:TonB-linked SusC/RagA family outer membrane protein